MPPTPIWGLAYLGLGGLMCHWGEVPLYMPVDAPHSNLGFGLSRSWRAYVLLGQGTAVHAGRCSPLQFWGLEGLCTTGARHCCTCQQMPPTPIWGLAYLGLGGLM